MVGKLSLRSHEEPEDVGGAISQAGCVKNMADDMLDIIWELEEGPDPQLESCIDWTRAHGMMSTCYTLFIEGSNLRYKLEERLIGDDDKEDENWQENGAQKDKANSDVNTDNNKNNNNNNNNNINNNNDYNNNNDNDNNNRLSNNNNDNNNISNNNDNNNSHSDNDVSINNNDNNNNSNNVNNYINNDEDYNDSDDHDNNDVVGIGADNNNNDDGDDNNNNCDDGGSGDSGGSDDGDRYVGIGDDNSDGDDNNNNKDGDDNNNNYEDGGNDDGGGSDYDGGSNDHWSSRAESISTTGKKRYADVVGSGVDTDKRVICGVMCLARWGFKLGLKDQSIHVQNMFVWIWRQAS
ncbi:hypothetical protein CBR_g44612 [Chara braunii]|uniref:Uncharacterized protein n=1 Tax=Chara braunii TaxID=69332 RepID=A0A388LXV1_CHABU|nr:hypothetical protein CBR_g44612 [Chara braunii]|eukprot:GBG87154.1 hypothetical protein CBR_g44612 [Chara braunii]